jgi:hypothetical protein
MCLTTELNGADKQPDFFEHRVELSGVARERHFLGECTMCNVPTVRRVAYRVHCTVRTAEQTTMCNVPTVRRVAYCVHCTMQST